MDYKLNLAGNLGGDRLEKEAYDLFVKDIFPSYEIFWKKFVVPRTNRPKDIHVKNEIDDDQYTIMMLSYTILDNLHFVAKNFINVYDRKMFENMYIRLSSAVDTCEEFMFKFFVWIDGREIDEIIIKYIPFDEKIHTVSNSVEEHQKNAVKELKKGKSYSIPMATKKEIITNLSQEAAVKDFFNLGSEIRRYRNVIVHSWLLPQVNKKFPKREALNANAGYRYWRSVQKDLHDDAKWKGILENIYIDMEELITNDFHALVKRIDSIYTVCHKML